LCCILLNSFCESGNLYTINGMRSMSPHRSPRLFRLLFSDRIVSPRLWRALSQLASCTLLSRGRGEVLRCPHTRHHTTGDPHVSRISARPLNWVGYLVRSPLSLRHDVSTGQKHFPEHMQWAPTKAGAFSAEPAAGDHPRGGWGG
jgi:hypothetical protein